MLAQHLWQEHLLLGEAQVLRLGLLGVVVLLSEADHGGVVQGGSQGAGHPAGDLLIGVGA